jgi:predicted regulator of Ras-like GTPase activity (Roadblock/LC7/MglB family)
VPDHAPLARLLELSTQVVEAVVVGVDGIEASSVADLARAEALALAASSLLETAAAVRPGIDVAVDRVTVETDTAALVVVREDGRMIVATTVPEPTLGLVVYDLRTALRAPADGEPSAGAATRAPRNGTGR